MNDNKLTLKDYNWQHHDKKITKEWTDKGLTLTPEMISHISHHLNNQLTIAFGNLSRLKRIEKDSTDPELLKSIRELERSLDNSIEYIKSLKKLEKGSK